MPLFMAQVQASTLACCGWNCGLKPRLRMPNFGRTSGPRKSSFISIRMSSARIFPLEAPLPLVGLRREEAPLETVQDSKKTLAVLTKHCLLDRVSISIPPVGLGLSPPQSKWFCKTRATYSVVEAVSLSKESSLWDVAYMGNFPRSPLELVLIDIICKTTRNPNIIGKPISQMATQVD